MSSVVSLLGFLIWVNFLPALAHLFAGERWAWPVDGGRQWTDARPLFGPHKTYRGIAVSVAGATAVSPLLGVPWWIAGLAALVAMAGDLMSSFIRRRLRYDTGKPAPVIDQVFEGLFPAPLLGWFLALPWWQVALAVALFIPVGALGSRFWSHLLSHPLPNYPRVIRSTVRLREWRACHQPLAHWHTWLNFENYVYYRVIMARLFRHSGWYARGLSNALAPALRHETLWFADLPAAFDGCRILLLTDLHLDGVEGLTEVIIEQIRPLEVDVCLIGGDIRMEMYGPMAPSLRLLRQLLAHVRAREGIFGVLGNHDCIEMLPDFEEAGVTMLVNDAREIRRNGRSLWLVGVDDPHYYKCHNVEMAFRHVPRDSFVVFLAHSPEAYLEAAQFTPQLYLCGHTHGGQICLPGFGPLFTHSSAPRFTAAGRWTYGAMMGFTSRGVGASGIPLRFNCPGEVNLITLRAGVGPAEAAVP